MYTIEVNGGLVVECQHCQGTTLCQKAVRFHDHFGGSTDYWLECQRCGVGYHLIQPNYHADPHLQPPVCRVCDGHGFIVINGANQRIASLAPSLDALLSESEAARIGGPEYPGSWSGLLEEAVTQLNDRERHILTERLKENPASCEELSYHFGISPERVRQIEVRAFKKLQAAFRAAAIARLLRAPD